MSDQEVDKQEYIEVKNRRQIEAILHAEKEEKAKGQKQGSTITNEKKGEGQKKKPLQGPKQKFIQDDRERVYPNNQQRYQEKGKKNQSEDTKQRQKYEKDDRTPEGKEKKPRYINKEHKQSRKPYENPRQADYRGNKNPYREKQTQYVEKDQQQRHHQNYEHRPKYVVKHSQKKQKKQIEFKYEVQTELLLMGDQQDYQNQIYVGKRDVEIYCDKARNLLKQYDFIVLKSFAIYVNKAFLVAGLLAKEIPQLKQINIPSTVQVRATNKNGWKFMHRGAIKIQLSLKGLNKQHMGYQQSPKWHASQKQQKTEYKQKQEPSKKYQQKKDYAEKRPLQYKQKRRTRSITEQEQRDLR